MNRLLAAIVLSLAGAFSVAADTKLLVSLLHYPTWSASPGDELLILPHIWNVGDEAARDVVLTFTLPPGSKFTREMTPSDWHCVADRSTMTCRIASIPARGREVDVYGEFAAIVGGEATGNVGLHYTVTSANAPREEQTLQFLVWRMLTVTSTGDSGPGSLRDVLERANQVCNGTEQCSIRFDVATPAKFEPLTPLPPITACGVISVDTRTSTRDNQYELSGARVGTGSGLEIRSQCEDGSRMLFVDGLTINDFPEDGMRILPAGAEYAVVLYDMRIGTDRTGTQPRPNGSRGIAVVSPVASLTVSGSVISMNARSGIYIWDARRAWIAENSIVGNGASGIFARRGWLQGVRNTITRNRHWGISVVPGANMGIVHHNEIHSNGGSPIDWGLDGPTLQESAGGAAAPVVRSATFDPETGFTTIRGTLDVRTVLGERYEVGIYSNAPGRAEAERWEGMSDMFSIYVPSPGIYEWKVVVRSDLRGRTLTAVTGVGIGDDFPTYTGSELSGPFEVN
ncbi:MAG TPA: right-handed parallel beta-helix repeat-containing protein [Thermoanaerobaculia bacterium]